MHIFVMTCISSWSMHLEKMNIAGIDMLPNRAVLVVYSLVKNFVRERLICTIGFVLAVCRILRAAFSFSQGIT